jgi:hypothetical protein
MNPPVFENASETVTTYLLVTLYWSSIWMLTEMNGDLVPSSFGKSYIVLWSILVSMKEPYVGPPKSAESSIST